MKTEISSPAPASSYGHSKLIAERTHEQWLARNPDARLTIVRPAVVFGPGENGNFARLAALLRKGFFVYPGRRDTIKACIYVEDLIAAIAFAESRTTRFVLFNGAYAQRHTIQTIVETIMKRYFPAARTFLVPGPAVRAAAKALRVVDALKIGIHPDRVTKLIRSTDICPKWLIDEGFVFPSSLGEVIDRWAAQTKGSFV